MSRFDTFIYGLDQQGGWFLWLIHQPLWVIAAVIIGSGLVMTVAGILLTHNYITSQRLMGNNLVATAKFVFMSQVFTGLMAFMLVEAGSRYANAESHIFDETQALRNLSLVVGQLPAPAAEAFREHLAHYAKAVVETEWQRMKAGNDSPFASEAFEQLVSNYFAIDPRDDHERSLLQLGNLFVGQAVEARTSRLNNNVSQDIASLTWVCLTGLVGITIAFNWFFGSPSLRSQLGMGVLLSFCILSCVVLIFLLGNPYAGDTAIEPTPFLQFTS
jgi:hypothetical protein